MAADLAITNAAASAAADAVVDRIDLGSGPGKVRIYDGTRAATADTAVGAQVLLAELTMSDPAFGAASNGVATASAITTDSSANATGTATWFRVVDSDNNAIFDGNVGTSGEDLNLNSVGITAGAAVAISSLTYTQPKT